MYLTLLRLDPHSSRVQRDLRDPHHLHQTVMRAFPPVIDPETKARATLGVLHRLEIERRTGRIMLYVQSSVEPDWSFLPAEDLIQDGLPNPACKPIGHIFERLKPGRTLRFRLRANPTKKIETKSGPNGEHRNGRRVPLERVDDVTKWLSRKAEQHGFDLLQMTIAASGAFELSRSYSTGRTFQGVVFEGRLVVRDPALFREALTKGIGSGKAFGFGLLSIGAE